MRAVQYRQQGRGLEVVDIDTPEPGPGEVRLRVTAAGLCHSDVALLDLVGDPTRYELPLTLGHEATGIVDALGPGVRGLELGEPVAVYGPWGCGRCAECARGAENYCPRAVDLGIRPPGVGAPGALAEFMLVDDARHLVPLGDLDPVSAAALTDAGLTPYHAIASVLGALVPGSTALVIGVGGLGHVAIQILRALSAAVVVAVDVDEPALALAEESGAHHVWPSDETVVADIRRLTGGAGAQAVFDFVGSAETVETARRSVAVRGVVQIVGLGGGLLPTGFRSTPLGASVGFPYWGTRPELLQVLALARAGLVRVAIEAYPLAEAPRALQRLREGRIRGRAVVVPGGRPSQDGTPADDGPCRDTPAPDHDRSRSERW